jgi:Ca2+-binding EF-hand superfamily protein
MDDNNSLTLDENEFVKAIKDYRVDIEENDIRRLFGAFDRDGSGELSYDEFLRSVRGPMNNKRK